MAFSTQKISGTILFAGSVIFIMLMNLAEWLYPGYNVSQNTISDLGATCLDSKCTIYQPTSIIFNSSVITLGILVILGSFFIYKGYNKKLFSFLLVVSGLGAIGVGLFPETTGIIHGIVSLIVFVFGGLSAVASLQFLRGPFRYFSVVLGLLTLLAVGLYVPGYYLGLGQGGMERVVVYPELLWGVGLGGYLLSTSENLKPRSIVAKP
jgi:hypothetical membrane protein